MILNIILVLVYMVFTVSGLICYKYGANNNFAISLKNSSFNLSINIIAILGIFFYLLSFLIYLLVLPKFNLTDILPIVSAITSIAIYILSVCLLKEEVSLHKIIGGAIIIIGIFIMTFNFNK